MAARRETGNISTADAKVIGGNHKVSGLNEKRLARHIDCRMATSAGMEQRPGEIDADRKVEEAQERDAQNDSSGKIVGARRGGYGESIVFWVEHQERATGSDASEVCK